MKKLVFASSNRHKIEEIKALLPEQIQVIGLSEAGIHQDIPETGNTIGENAILKAKFVDEFLKNQGLHLPVLADDSGLEVKALNGAPGVYSARYAGEPKNDSANNTKLLEELQSVTKREARFVTVLAYTENNQLHCFEGEVKGTIAYAPKGNTGFGYDPLFIPRGYRSTFAELGHTVKNGISHRAEAVKKFMTFISSRH